MTGAQFKQNHSEIVKPSMCCDAANTVAYSEWLGMYGAIHIHLL